jgi:hypothetical protein
MGNIIGCTSSTKSVDSRIAQVEEENRHLRLQAENAELRLELARAKEKVAEGNNKRNHGDIQTIAVAHPVMENKPEVHTGNFIPTHPTAPLLDSGPSEMKAGGENGAPRISMLVTENEGSHPSKISETAKGKNGCSQEEASRVVPVLSESTLQRKLISISGTGLGIPTGEFTSSGRFCRFNSSDLTAIVEKWCAGSNVSDLYEELSGPGADTCDFDLLKRRFHIKSLGAGASFRVKNTRTGYSSGLCVWRWGRGEKSGDIDVIGCWNPLEYCGEDSFQIGDKLVFLDSTPDARSAFLGFSQAKIKNVELGDSTGTGWNIDPRGILFGECGIVGGWWKSLVVDFSIEESKVVGIRSDSCELPFSIYAARGDQDEWTLLAEGCTGPWHLLREPFVGCKVRVAWENTDLHKSCGLSTYRAGGGFHAEVYCDPAER